MVKVGLEDIPRLTFASLRYVVGALTLLIWRMVTVGSKGPSIPSSVWRWWPRYGSGSPIAWQRLVMRGRTLLAVDATVIPMTLGSVGLFIVAISWNRFGSGVSDRIR